MRGSNTSCYTLKNNSTGIVYAISYFKLFFAILVGGISGDLGGTILLAWLKLNLHIFFSVLAIDFGSIFTFASIVALNFAIKHLRANLLLGKNG